MADFQIGNSFVKANRTVVRGIKLTGANRLYATRSAGGLITLPTLPSGSDYINFQAVTQASFSVNDQNKDFRLLGDDGWSDSVITGSSVQSSVTAFFQRNIEANAGSAEFRGEYDEAFALIEAARYDKTQEIYFEFLKELGLVGGSGADASKWSYDFAGFNGVIMNYKESNSAENLIEVSFDIMSRGRPVFGRYLSTTQLSVSGLQ